MTNSFDAKKSLTVNGKKYTYYALQNTVGDIAKLPNSLKVLLENLLRYEDGNSVKKADVEAVVKWLDKKTSEQEIAYRPARVLMQDFTGVPAVVDLAAMRDAMENLGGDAEKINPLSPVDLVIDHSVMVDQYGNESAFEANMRLEFQRNAERYKFLKWGQSAFQDFRAVPPGTGICHQVNVEYLGQCVWTKDIDGETVAYPDTLVGTDSHTTMINGLGILGWGVGGIEAEAAMLGQPISMVIPEVVGFELKGKLPEGSNATDLVLTVTEMLRAHGCVGKFVEFYGSGLAELPLADRATIANMAPEYGATCGFFPIDDKTLDYLRFTGREEERIALVEAYAKEQGLWADPNQELSFTSILSLDLSSVVPSIAGPKRPQDRIRLDKAGHQFREKDFPAFSGLKWAQQREVETSKGHSLKDGALMIAAITSCTNTSNPSVMIAAGLVAKNAVARGMKVPEWVKTSLAPGSQVVTDYLEKANLQDDLNALGFNLVGYGCTTCIGNSGPLADEYIKAIEENDLVVCAVLSGNRNFEGRVSPQTKGNYLASPPLVVAYALAGTMGIDLMEDSLGNDKDGNPVYLKDIWPSSEDIAKVVQQSLTPAMFKSRYENVFAGGKEWRDVKVSGGKTYDWESNSTYIKNPPYFEGMRTTLDPLEDITNARPLAILGDSITTDHISPAGAIKADSPAGKYLQEHGVEKRDFNSYGSRRGNHEVMMRGTFANVRLQNEMTPDVTGGWTRHEPSAEQMFIYDASMKYQAADVPLVVVGGKEYGTGSSRDWAAKGTNLLGVKAVIVESFERIHRSNLVGMGVLPLQFTNGDTRQTLKLDGTEKFDITGIADGLKAGDKVQCTVHYKSGDTKQIELLCRLDTADEVTYFENGGILHYVLRRLATGSDGAGVKAA